MAQGTDDGAVARARLAAFSARVRELRNAKGWSQEELAHHSGLHRTYISSVERGQRNISLSNIYALADALGVKARDLFVEGER